MRPTRPTKLTRGVLGLACAFAAIAAPAFAQAPPSAPAAAPATTVLPKTNTRLPLFVIDARGVFARLGQDPTTAAGLSTSALALPARGLGGVAGAQIYIWRGRSMALGVGGEGILARARHELTDTAGKPTGTVIMRRLRGASGQLSLNFGHRAGWSYITAGLGPTAFESYIDGATPDGLRVTSLNYGGGARWFNVEHVAFSVDMRFYQTKPALATPNTAARARKNLIVFSAGIAIK